MSSAGDRLGVGRACPRCGVRSDTLGRVCPACKKPYASGGLLDLVTRPVALPLLALVGLALTIGWVWLLFTDTVVGVALVGIAFVVLVAAIGLANAFADDHR